MTATIYTHRTTLTPVYAAAQRFVDAALRHDGSLFTPGSAIWTEDNVRQFHFLYVENQDHSKASFNQKLLRQLEAASPEVTQAAAELLFFHSLGISNQGPASKRAMIDPLLARIGIRLPAELAAALDDGVANHGAGLAHRDAYVKLLTKFMLAWKQLPNDAVSALLVDPEGFRTFVSDLPQGADAAQRNMLIHLVFPDTFEPVASPYVKRDIIKAFAEFVSDQDAHVDAKLADIREALSGRHGQRFDFYAEELQSQWGEIETVPVDRAADPVAAIAALMETLYPDADLRALVLGVLADAIEAAHEAGPNSWGVGPDAKLTYLSLNVGRLATVVLQREQVLLALDVPSLDASLIAQLDEAADTPAGTYDSMPSSRYWRLRPDAVPALLDQLTQPLMAHIANAASAVEVTPYARFHSTAAIEYVGGATGRDLPTPEHRALPQINGKSGWDGLVAWAARVFDEERFDDRERNYKLAIAERIRAARTAFLSGADDWGQHLKDAFIKENNLTPWQQHSKFYQWARAEADLAGVALDAIWDDELDVAERIRGFCDSLPREVIGGVGTRLAIASFLLMVDPGRHPIYRPTPFQDAWRITAWAGPDDPSDEALTYESALEFMDELRARLSDVGVATRDRLDAQGLIWAVVSGSDPPQYLSPDERERLMRFRSGNTESIPVAEELVDAVPAVFEGYVEPSFDDIVERFEAAGFRISPETLLRYHLSLKTRGFVILSGVSGTGKSWLTRLYADAVGGEAALVPVAPNWTTNEDLLGFHNPVTGEYVDTDFSRFLRRAVAEQERADAAGVEPRPFFLILDEMNLARVEYYFAKFLSVMEARGQQDVAIELSASERLALPENLYAVGTVNVDETTHGFADKVYDRAQVLELSLTEYDLVEYVGRVDHAEALLNVWRAVRHVAPFAYRVADEVARYVRGATDAGLDWQEALDHQVLQKVLPKLARADDRVGAALDAVVDACSEMLPLSAAKATAMRRHLEEHGFPSYF